MSIIENIRLAVAGAMVGNCLTGTAGFLLHTDVEAFRLPAAALGLLSVAVRLWRESQSTT